MLPLPRRSIDMIANRAVAIGISPVIFMHSTSNTFITKERTRLERGDSWSRERRASIVRGCRVVDMGTGRLFSLLQLKMSA
jgi:hypothetical protein